MATGLLADLSGSSATATASGTQIGDERDLGRLIRDMLSARRSRSSCYGAVLGAFSDNALLQAPISAIKLPLLFLVTLAICLPTLYLFNLVFGARLQVKQALALVMVAITVISMLALAFAPISLFFLITANQYSFYKLLNVAILTLAAIVGLRFLTARHGRAEQPQRGARQVRGSQARRRRPRMAERAAQEAAQELGAQGDRVGGRRCWTSPPRRRAARPEAGAGGRPRRPRPVARRPVAPPGTELVPAGTAVATLAPPARRHVPAGARALRMIPEAWALDRRRRQKQASMGCCTCGSCCSASWAPSSPGRCGRSSAAPTATSRCSDRSTATSTSTSCGRSASCSDPSP